MFSIIKNVFSSFNVLVSMASIQSEEFDQIKFLLLASLGLL